jgi:hypothetical protein
LALVIFVALVTAAVLLAWDGDAAGGSATRPVPLSGIAIERWLTGSGPVHLGYRTRLAPR